MSPFSAPSMTGRRASVLTIGGVVAAILGLFVGRFAAGHIGEERRGCSSRGSRRELPFLACLTSSTFRRCFTKPATPWRCRSISSA